MAEELQGTIHSYHHESFVKGSSETLLSSPGLFAPFCGFHLPKNSQILVGVKLAELNECYHLTNAYQTIEPLNTASKSQHNEIVRHLIPASPAFMYGSIYILTYEARALKSRSPPYAFGQLQQNIL